VPLLELDLGVRERLPESILQRVVPFLFQEGLDVRRPFAPCRGAAEVRAADGAYKLNPIMHTCMPNHSAYRIYHINFV